MSDVEIAPCRYCGVRKPIDVWCSSEQCAERVEKAQAEEREYIRRAVAPEEQVSDGEYPVEKIGMVVPVSEELLRYTLPVNWATLFGPDTRTDEQRAADEERYEQERAEKWAEIAAEHARHVAATDGVARAVLELHAPVQDFHGVGAHCDGCDASGYEWEPPGWPCRTYELVTDDGSGQ